MYFRSSASSRIVSLKKKKIPGKSLVEFSKRIVWNYPFLNSPLVFAHSKTNKQKKKVEITFQVPNKWTDSSLEKESCSRVKWGSGGHMKFQSCLPSLHRGLACVHVLIGPRNVNMYAGWWDPITKAVKWFSNFCDCFPGVKRWWINNAK